MNATTKFKYAVKHRNCIKLCIEGLNSKMKRTVLFQRITNIVYYNKNCILFISISDENFAPLYLNSGVFSFFFVVVVVFILYTKQSRTNKDN